MKKLLANNRNSYLLMALTGAVLLMVPLITGAAPNAAPPNGTTTPTFSGLNINDGSKNNFNVTGSGVLSNPVTTNQDKTTCEGNGGFFYGSCDYPVTISDYGGIRVRSDEPNTPPGWFFADTKINGNGVNIYSQDDKALNVHATTEVVDLYKTDFNVNSNGFKAAVQDTDGGSYMTYKGLDATNLDNMKLYSSNAQSYADPGDSSTWQSGALINLDAWNSVLKLGAKKLSLGNYAATNSHDAPLFTETATLDNTTTPASFNVDGHIKATSGIGTYSSGTTVGTANANTGKYFTAPCPSGYKVVSCGYSWPNYSKTLDLVWMYPSVDKCVYNFWNYDTVARSLTGYTTCYNDKI